MLYYELLGQGEPIVLLHGYMENLKMWSDLAKTLEKQYQVVLIDLPGHGQSENYDEVHTMELMAEKVHEVLAHLSLDKVAMLGHSMGGYVTLAFAEKYPEKLSRIGLLNSTVLPDSEQKQAQRLQAVEAAEKNLDTLIKVSVPLLFAKQNVQNLHAEIEFTKELARETSLQGVTAALKGMRLRPDRRYILQDFDQPIGILLGTYDEAVNPDEFRKLIPRKPDLFLEELATGHMAHLEAPFEALKFIQDWMNLN